MKNRIIRILGVLAAVFLALNAAWFLWRYLAYSGYRDGMPKAAFSNVFHLTYVDKDEDGFDYNVKYPDYLMFTGNLAVGYPGTGEDPFTDGLIIWPRLPGSYEYGIILNPRENDAQGYMFYIDPSGNAVDGEYQEVAQEYQEVIQELLRRANSRWDLT